MADDQVDWNTLARELMQVLSTGESLRPDQPYTSRDPGTKYRSGELTSDVGFLDPVDMLSGMLASKGASLVRGAGRALTEPGPSLGSLMRSQRGSTGGPVFPWQLHRSEEELEALAQRITAAMAKDPTLPPGSKAPRRLPGESLQTWENQLSKYEHRYNFEDLYNRKFEGLNERGEVELAPGEQALTSEETGLTPERIADYMEKMSEPQRRFQANEARVNPYEGGKGPAKRVIDMAAPEAEPQSRANEYAEIIRKLFEREGR